MFHYLDQPGQKENEGYKVDESNARLQAVHGSIHKEHPSFLGGRLIHGEETGSWNCLTK